MPFFLQEVTHLRHSIKYSKKKMWYPCVMVCSMYFKLGMIIKRQTHKVATIHFTIDYFDIHKLRVCSGIQKMNWSRYNVRV